MFSSKRSRVIAAGVAAIAIAGGSYGIVTATSSSASAAPAASSSPAGGSGSGGGSNARSGPAAGGSSGTVSSMSSSGFTVTTATGQKVTIKEASSTTYEKGTGPATASAVTTGEPVLVLGTTDNTTITATQVVVQPPSTSASNPGGQVIPYSKGENGSSKQPARSRRTTARGPGRSSAERPRPRRPKRRWPPTRAASSTAWWPSATAITRSTTSASTGPTTSSSTRTSRSSAPTTSRHGQAAPDRHSMNRQRG